MLTRSETYVKIKRRYIELQFILLFMLLMSDIAFDISSLENSLLSIVDETLSELRFTN